jgi:hypothetical protein
MKTFVTESEVSVDKVAVVRRVLTCAWLVALAVGVGMFLWIDRSIALAIVGLIGGIGAAWASFFSAGIIGSQLQPDAGGSRILGHWTFEHAPLLCWPLVSSAYSPETRSLRGVSREAVLLFRTSHVVFVVTVLLLLTATRVIVD